MMQTNKYNFKINPTNIKKKNLKQQNVFRLNDKILQISLREYSVVNFKPHLSIWHINAHINIIIPTCPKDWLLS